MNLYDDKQMTTDVLSTQKHIADGCNSFANEAASPAVKDTFMNILNEEHEISHEVFDLMSRRGWYPTETAPADKIACVKNKFCQGAQG